MLRVARRLSRGLATGWDQALQSKSLDLDAVVSVGVLRRWRRRPRRGLLRGLAWEVGKAGVGGGGGEGVGEGSGERMGADIHWVGI